MTDNLKGVTVTFEYDIREDNAKDIIDAIRMIKGVLSVETSVADYNDIINRTRIRRELKEKLLQVLD